MKDNTIGLSHPCAVCAQALEQAPFCVVYYSIDSQTLGHISSKNISRHHQGSSQRKTLHTATACNK